MKEVYLEQPPGFVAQGEYGRVRRLRKTLYGLKQSPRDWSGRLVRPLNNLGFERANLATLYFSGTQKMVSFS